VEGADLAESRTGTVLSGEWSSFFERVSEIPEHDRGAVRKQEFWESATKTREVFPLPVHFKDRGDTRWKN